MGGREDRSYGGYERYKNPPEEDILYNLGIFKQLLDEFCEVLKVTVAIDYNVSAVYEIFRRLDQRIHYYRYFHSTDEEPMYISDAKRRAVLSYWIIKYKPLSIRDLNDANDFLKMRGCSINELFVFYIYAKNIATSSAGPMKNSNISEKMQKTLLYYFYHRNISIEAMTLLFGATANDTVL